MKTTQSYGRLVAGVVLFVLGLVFLLDEFGIIRFSLGEFIGTWWPLAIIAGGVFALMNNPRSFIFPLFLILVGILLQFQQFDYVSGNVWGIIWPTALLVFGASLFFERSQPAKPATEDEEDDDEHPSITNSEDIISVFACFYRSTVRNTSHNFQGGDATAILGSFEIDLREAKMKKKADLSVFTALGSGVILVPEGWRVQVSGLPLLGSWDNQTQAPKNKNAPVLHIRGTFLLGSTTITHKER